MHNVPRFWMQTETHVYAMAISACVLLAFFPFLIVMLSLAQYVFKWKAAEQAVYFALNHSFPDQLGEYLQRNLRAVIWQRGPFQLFSLFLLLLTANGIFQPLEVALKSDLALHRKPILSQEPTRRPGSGVRVRRADSELRPCSPPSTTSTLRRSPASIALWRIS